ncbi:PREDICTED: uncharacterized protein LOC106748244 [Dinoponera quadriceps]|uniref:Uncharacterized protein LOC106748244 n=1 Tax=Dinoponera quadriceps TaxID=609295 RepID=A0A6P3XVX0_DINQU|nr:PREDICTED: uncharacterized protein LOC106748244 [Dinoponera quadriceps]
MQAAGTLRGTTRVISLLVLLVSLIGRAYSLPLQYLPSIPGYVPVYIRYGDEPLEDINPELAEAFGEASSSAKLDRTLAHEPDNFKDNDIDALLEESAEKHAYPLRIRATESRSFATVNDDEPGNKPKLLTIYQLPDDNENRRNRGRSRGRNRNRSRPRHANWGPPTLKVSPLSDAEKEELEKLAIEVEKEETKPNELYAPSSKSSELPHATARNRHRAHKFAAPIKVQDPLDESSSSDLSQEISQAADLPEPSRNRNHGRPRADKSRADAAPEAGKRERKHEPPVKEQRPATILSNVDKISPIDLPESAAEKGDKPRNTTEANDEIAME